MRLAWIVLLAACGSSSNHGGDDGAGDDAVSPDGPAVCSTTACTTDSDCCSTVCSEDLGTCVADAGVRYASPTGSPTSDCTLAAPCDVGRAFTIDPTGRPIVRLLPGEYVTDASCRPTACSAFSALIGTGAKVTHTGAFVEMIGGRIEIEGLELAAGTELSCHPFEGGGGDLVLSHVVSRGSITGSRCRLAVSDSEFHVASGSGLVASTGSLSVARSRFYGEGGMAGISVDKTSATVTNSLFVGFATAIKHGTTGVANVSFSTFVDAPIACELAANGTYANNILYSTTAAAPVDAASTCQFHYDLVFPAVDPAGSDHLIHADPKLVSATDLHLQADSPAIDAADPAATNATDLEGHDRPRGAGRDVGAYEH